MDADSLRITGDQFREALKGVGLNIADFCRRTSTPRTTVERWLYDGTRVPGLAMAWVSLYGKNKDA